MSDLDEWEGTLRGSCLKCGSENVSHHYLGMPDFDMVQLAPHWVSWSCVSGPQDRSCEDCDFLWCSPGELAGFRNAWEVLAYYDVRTLNELGRVLSEENVPGISLGLLAEEIGFPGSEALVLIIGKRRKEISFPFSNPVLLGVIDELADVIAEGPGW